MEPTLTASQPNTVKPHPLSPVKTMDTMIGIYEQKDPKFPTMIVVSPITWTAPDYRFLSTHDPGNQQNAIYTPRSIHSGNGSVSSFGRIAGLFSRDFMQLSVDLYVRTQELPQVRSDNIQYLQLVNHPIVGEVFVYRGAITHNGLLHNGQFPGFLALFTNADVDAHSIPKDLEGFLHRRRDGTWLRR